MSATPEQIAERLEKPANWLRQDRGEHWKSVTNIYDRAPFEAAALIRAQAERVRVLEGLVKAAFYEGFNSYKTPCVAFFGPDEEWEASEARAALNAGGAA